VFLYIHAVVRHSTLFVWVHYYNYFLLTASYSCILIYPARLLPADVTSYAARKPIELRHTLTSGIELAVYIAFINEVEFEDTLRLTVSESVSLGVKPHLGLMTRFLIPFDSYGLVFVGRPL
jgi:hypothetical protein